MSVPEIQHLKFIVLVKAAPVLTRRLEETMCVAGIRLGPNGPEWVRLHPVPFRDLDDASKFAKYQHVEVDVLRPKSDRRPESWSPVSQTIRLGETITPARGWERRRHLVDQLPEAAMCDLIDANRAGSGRGVPSLAVVRPVERPRLLITERDRTQLEDWQRRADAAAGRISLFDDAMKPKPPFEVVPWRFQYVYRCSSPGCSGSHTQTIVDWEVLALWRHVRDRLDWQDQMRRKFEDELWENRDAVLFVGNQVQYPISFLVLGVFWPPAGPVQGLLDL